MSRLLPLLILCACPRSGPVQSVPQSSTATWVVRAGEHIAPEALGSLMQQNFDVKLLVSAVWSPEHLALNLGALGPDGLQDPCSPTTTLDAEIRDGAFEAVGVTIPFRTDGLSGALTQATVRGTLNPSPTLAHISGSFDTRAVAELAGDGPMAACDLLNKLVACGPCPDGSADTCWSLTLTDLASTPTDLVWTPVEADVQCAP